MRRLRPIRKVHIPFLLGLGLTLPLFGQTVIFHRKKPIGRGTLAHEIEHARQVERLGSVRYLLIHVWARIMTRNIWGQGHWIEDDAYKAGDEA